MAQLIGEDWQIKNKKSVGLKSVGAVSYYSDLIEVRRQLRNFIAHGAFGKNGEAFDFHSKAGAVPLQLTSIKHKNKFTISTRSIAFRDSEIITLLEDFVAFLWKSDLSAAMEYAQKSELPSILTMANGGKYQSAMKSTKDRKELIEYLTHQFDRAGDMDW